MLDHLSEVSVFDHSAFALFVIFGVSAAITLVGVHVADLWGIPAIGLFGPTRPETWGFRFSDTGVHVDGRGSMQNISVEQVVSAFSSIYEAPTRQLRRRSGTACAAIGNEAPNTLVADVQ
jgi:hypothetical protein